MKIKLKTDDIVCADLIVLHKGQRVELKRVVYVDYGDGYYKARFSKKDKTAIKVKVLEVKNIKFLGLKYKK